MNNQSLESTVYTFQIYSQKILWSDDLVRREGGSGLKILKIIFEITVEQLFGRVLRHYEHAHFPAQKIKIRKLA